MLIAREDVKEEGGRTLIQIRWFILHMQSKAELAFIMRRFSTLKTRQLVSWLCWVLVHIYISGREPIEKVWQEESL